MPRNPSLSNVFPNMLAPENNLHNSIDPCITVFSLILPSISILLLEMPPDIIVLSLMLPPLLPLIEVSAANAFLRIPLITVFPLISDPTYRDWETMAEALTIKQL